MDQPYEMDCQGQDHTSESEEGLFALIIGIDGYPHKPLHCAVNDAVSLSETLQKVWKSRKVTIKTLIWPSLNAKQAKIQGETWGIELPPDASGVTRTAILDQVRFYSTQAQPSDTFLFYFSGHGVCTGEQPALVTVADGKTASGKEYLTIKEIQQAAADSASHKKIMILDCCQSAIRKKETSHGYKNLQNLTQGWSILISSSPGEVSLEDHYAGESSDDYLQQGIFTARLVEGLRGEAVGSNGTVNLADLAHFVGKWVPVEYDERLKLRQKRFMDEADKRNKQKNHPHRDTRGEGVDAQNPVLLCDAVARGGPYEIIIAPDYVPAAHDSRRKRPSEHFLKNWFHFLKKPWPIFFPYRFAFGLAGWLYALAMMFTLLWHAQDAAYTLPVLIFSGLVGVGSILLWWLTVSFAVAANEDYWHMGGYFNVLFYFIWHGIVILGSILIYSASPPAIRASVPSGYLIFELFFLFVAVTVFNCNACHTIIALAETLRTDERREIRQAVRIFQEFKSSVIGVDLFNYVALISLRPDAYFYIWIVSIVLVGSSLLRRLMEGVTAYLDIVVMRDIFVLSMITVLVMWYYSAFKHFQQDVYKR